MFLITAKLFPLLPCLVVSTFFLFVRSAPIEMEYSAVAAPAVTG